MLCLINSSFCSRYIYMVMIKRGFLCLSFCRCVAAATNQKQLELKALTRVHDDNKKWQKKLVVGHDDDDETE